MLSSFKSKSKDEDKDSFSPNLAPLGYSFNSGVL